MVGPITSNYCICDFISASARSVCSINCTFSTHLISYICVNSLLSLSLCVNSLGGCVRKLTTSYLACFVDAALVGLTGVAFTLAAVTLELPVEFHLEQPVQFQLNQVYPQYTYAYSTTFFTLRSMYLTFYKLVSACKT